MINFLIAAIIGYGIGSIPFGKYYVWYFRGIDIQQIGSGRTGGTNSIRAGGWTLGWITAFSDVLKGICSILLLRWALGGQSNLELLPWWEITTGVFSVVGHNWSYLAGFRGGAGTGPNLGWSSAIYPPLFPIGFIVMFSGIFLFGYASVASLLMALIVPVGFTYLYFVGSPILTHSLAYSVGGLITFGLIVFSLRPNISRLLRGEERAVGLRALLAKRSKNRGDHSEIPSDSRQTIENPLDQLN